MVTLNEITPSSKIEFPKVKILNFASSAPPCGTIKYVSVYKAVIYASRSFTKPDTALLYVACREGYANRISANNMYKITVLPGDCYSSGEVISNFTNEDINNFSVTKKYRLISLSALF